MNFMKKKWFRMLFCTMSVACTMLVIAGCNKGIDESSKKSTGLESVVTDRNVVATLTTEHEAYEQGELIHFKLTVTNNREFWIMPKTEVKFTNVAGLSFADGSQLTASVPELNYGDSYVFEGDVSVDVTKLALANFKQRVQALKKSLGLEPLKAYAENTAEIELRPYLTIPYGNSEVTLRMVIESKMRVETAYYGEYAKAAKTICCHDPSIFKDKNGVYYIVGSFLAGGTATDLHEWTSIDAKLQGSFSADVRNKIREWNADENAGAWNDYLWAPDIIYNPVLDKYCMYLSANGDNWVSNIVLLTADEVEGPYDYVGTVVYGGFKADTYTQTDLLQVVGGEELPERYTKYGVKNKRWGDEYPNCIDPCVFYDEQGNLWMSYGSWSGGIFMLALDENTGLRDYSVSYDTNTHSDAYFGTKIAGGKYVSGEASYIQHIGDYYYLFMSYGNLEADGGYNIRVFRSENPDGPYVDELGNSSLYDKYVFNYNQSVGVRLFGAYRWRNFSVGQVSQGHNSAFVDDDGKAYIVFHTRTTDGSEGHYVKIHQLFVNKEGWLVAAPYYTFGETLEKNKYTAADFVGTWEVIVHELDVDYKNKITNKPEAISLNEDGTVTGAYEGTWSYDPSESYFVIHVNDEDYSGVALSMKIEYTTLETMVFTALGLENQITIWGSKSVE